MTERGVIVGGEMHPNGAEDKISFDWYKMISSTHFWSASNCENRPYVQQNKWKSAAVFTKWNVRWWDRCIFLTTPLMPDTLVPPWSAPHSVMYGLISQIHLEAPSSPWGLIFPQLLQPSNYAQELLSLWILSWTTVPVLLWKNNFGMPTVS